MEKSCTTLKEVGIQGGEVGQVKRNYLGQVEENMSKWMDAKALQQDLESLGFTPSKVKPGIGKEVGRRRACL